MNLFHAFAAHCNKNPVITQSEFKLPPPKQNKRDWEKKEDARRSSRSLDLCVVDVIFCFLFEKEMLALLTF
jgi:hypothetical protein